MRGSRQRWIAIAAALLLLVFMTTISRDFGFTWDERFQQKYGEEIWDYFHGRIPRATFDTDEGNQYLYGGVVEWLSVAAQHSFHGDTYVIRHVVVSVFGWFGIVITALTAARLFGSRAGWLAGLFLAVSPRYFGDAMNNPKDIPFAAFAMATLYLSLNITARPPYLTWRRTALLALTIALAINVRPLGLVLLAYSIAATCAIAAWSLWRERPAGPSRVLASLALKLVVLTAIVIPAGTIFWPWAQGSPFVRPLQGFLLTTKLDWARGFDVLYAGIDMGAGDVPWSYVPWWLWMTTPLVVLIGAAASWLAWRRDVRATIGWLGLAAFVATPVVAAIVRNATIYDGIRHLEFIVPPLTALAAAGWSGLLELPSTRIRLAVAAVLAIGVAEPLLFQIRNHPNQIVYFTPQSGGPRAAFARYDMDYWGNSVLQAVRWAAEEAERSGFPIIVSGNPIQAVEADALRFRSLMPVPRASNQYHFDIRLLRGPSKSVAEFASRPDIIHAVRMADGTPLCIVIPGPAYLNISDRLARE